MGCEGWIEYSDAENCTRYEIKVIMLIFAIHFNGEKTMILQMKMREKEKLLDMSWSVEGRRGYSKISCRLGGKQPPYLRGWVALMMPVGLLRPN